MEDKKVLAHIEKIQWIKNIENADNLLLCGILGWQCVISKKENFKKGDLVIYIEVGSVCPEKPEFEFLRKYDFRIKTQKMRGVLSQGLVIPLNTNDTYNEGEDVTELLGITKYYSKEEQAENEAEQNQIKNETNKLKKFMLRYSWFRRFFLSRTQKDGFPYWISKTDELKLQNAPHLLEQFKDKEVYITEKIDFQSVTFTGKIIPKFSGLLGKLIPIKKYKFIVCSKNLTTNDKSSLYWKIAEKYNIEQILKENPTLTIQGKQGDTKVQGNKYGITEPTMWVFNIIDHEKNYHYSYNELISFCVRYNLNYVPHIPILKYSFEEGHVNRCTKLSELGSTVQELVEFSKGKSVLNNKVERKGIVISCIENGKKLLSVKVINPQFLLDNKL